MNNLQPTEQPAPNLQDIERFLTTGDRAALQPRQRASLRKSALDAITDGKVIRTDGMAEIDRTAFIRLVRAESFRYRNRGEAFKIKKTYLP
jgi:hypothetical protein